MKCAIPEISWHNREPVLSIHVQPISEKFYRLATGGADCHVLIWQLSINENGSVKIEALSDLTRHQRAVNSVRWSLNGQYLASADDDANIIIWQLKTDNIPLLEGETNDKETWVVHKILRGHKEDVYDLCWAPNGLKLLSGSIDNTAILWDFNTGKCERILTDHKGFVQGVAWDPKSFYLATISTDRVCRIYDNIGKNVKTRIQKGLLPVPEDHYLHNKDVKFFQDDTFKSFFRRLDFSPDGSLLAVPSSRIELEDCKQITNATLLFAVDLWSPIAVLPCGKQCSTVVRFCPILYEIWEDGPEPVIALPFRMVFAVGTDHDIILYDTQQMEPFAYFKDIHYTRLTDLSWSHDGRLLIASSTDGYCSLVTFEPEELGKEYFLKEESVLEDSCMDVSGCEELDKEDTESKPKKLSLLEKWTVKTPKRNKDANESKIEDENEKSLGKRKLDGEVNILIPKRIKPIPVIDDKNKAGSPLSGFLKKPNKKEKTVDTKEEPSVNLTLDENDARDAWKCEKEEVEPPKTVIIDEEYTEEFSLHLEDTNSQLTDKNGVESSSKVEAKECQQKCDKPQEKTTEEKVCVPKRRVPLITLSSPKQKKK